MKVIIPTEIRMPIGRTKIPKKENVEVVAKDQDVTDELREATTVCIASYQYSLEKLAQPTCKATYIPSRRISLKKGL